MDLNFISPNRVPQVVLLRVVPPRTVSINEDILTKEGVVYLISPNLRAVLFVDEDGDSHTSP